MDTIPPLQRLSRSGELGSYPGSVPNRPTVSLHPAHEGTARLGNTEPMSSHHQHNCSFCTTAGRLGHSRSAIPHYNNFTPGVDHSSSRRTLAAHSAHLAAELHVLNRYSSALSLTFFAIGAMLSAVAGLILADCVWLDDVYARHD